MAVNIKALAVVDASFFLAYLLPDENHPSVDQLMDQHLEGLVDIHVPQLFYYEIASSLNTAILRQRISLTEGTSLLTQTLNLKFINHPNFYPNLLPLAQAHHLSIYDASYLQLSRELQAPLYSLDQKLSRLAPATA